jgi:hypothetical protein
MNAIRIHRQLDSETLHLPELKPLIGKRVEIIVLEEKPAPLVRPGTGDWDAARRAVSEIKDYDFEALRAQQECDLGHAQDHLP